MWTGREYFMEKQPKANKQKKEKLYILSTISEMCQEHRWGIDKCRRSALAPSWSALGLTSLVNDVMISQKVHEMSN